MLRSTTLCWNSTHVATRRFRNLSISRIGTRYMCSCSSQTRLYQPQLRWVWSSIAETSCWCRSCYSNLQHCWRHICLPARQCASTSCSWHSWVSAQWDTAVHQSWHVASQQSWPQPDKLPHLWHAARSRVSSTNPRYRQVAEASHCNMGRISAEHGGRCSWSMAKKTGTIIHVSVQKVITWSFSVTLPAWHSSCHTSQPVLFRSANANPRSALSRATNVLRNATLPLVRWKSFAFYKVVW